MLPIVRPRLPELPAIADRFSRALYQGHVTNNGEHVRRFERKLAEYVRARTLCFNNGQTALLGMLMAAGVKAGEEVICPSFTFCGTVAAIKMLGTVPVFAEVDAVTLTLDPADVEKRITGNTAAILGVDVYGICCEYKALSAIAQTWNIPVLFDSAPSFGSIVNAFPTGNYGDAQIFSFHATKPFSTMEGGALCSNNETIIERAKQIRDFGQDDEKSCKLVGLNGKMLEVCALIGLENLKDWLEYCHKRTFRYFTFAHKLHGIKGLRITPTPQDQWPIWAYAPVFIEPEFGMSRDEVLKALHAKNIMARTYYSACHLLPAFANGQSLPITELLASQVIALPIYSDFLEEEMNEIADTLRGLSR